jgi:hypothetical protein
MDAKQLELIRREQDRPKPKLVTAQEFAQEGTLVYGYTVERDTFHVYAKDGMLHRFIYRTYLSNDVHVIAYEAREAFEAVELSPSKAIYWQRSDFEFCMRLAELQVYMHFKLSGPAIQERAEVPQFEGAVYDPAEHTTWERRDTLSRMG